MAFNMTLYRNANRGNRLNGGYPSGDEPSVAATLMNISDFTYAGAFRLPQGIFGASEFGYSEGIMDYNANNDSLFIVGHTSQQAVAEIAIPTIVNEDTVIGNLNTATVLQNFSTVLDRATDSPGESTDTIGGLYYDGTKLFVNGYNFYNADGSYEDSTLVMDAATDLAGSAVRGFFQLNGRAHASGHITPVPAALQAELGGPFISGLSGVNIITRACVGPAGFIWDPTDIGPLDTGGAISSIPVLDYDFNPSTQRIASDLYNSDLTNDLWTYKSRATYGMIPTGSRSYCNFGYSGGHNVGLAYGDPSVDATPPYAGDKGYYALQEYDNNVHYYWFYDVDDLVDVKNGVSQTYNPRPYAYGEWTVPFTATQYKQLKGGAYDPTNNRLFLSLSFADGNNPLILVYNVGTP